MPHLLNMPQSYQEVLNRTNTPKIGIRILLYVKTFKIESAYGGKIQYDINDTQETCLDVTSLVKNASVVINKSIPELPTFTGSGSVTQYGELGLQLQKGYGAFLQYVGQGAGIVSLKTSRVEVYSTIEGHSNLNIRQYTGKIRKNPIETYEDVTFAVNPAMWDILNKELFTNQHNTNISTSPGSGVIVETNDTYLGITTPAQRMTYRHPVMGFNEKGQTRALVNSSEAATIDLFDVVLSQTQSAKLGKYSFKWLSASQVEAVTPSAGTHTLSHTTITASGVVNVNFPAALQAATGVIKVSFYVVNPATPQPFDNIKGKSVELWLSYTVEGNPISIALDLIMRTLTGDWNTATALTMNANLPINYDAFMTFEPIFDFITLYVSEWNEDNKPYSYLDKSKPLQAKNIIQKVLDHIGCQLTFDEYGKISINSNWFYVEPYKFWRIGSIHCGGQGAGFIPSHKVNGATEYKRMELFHGYNPFTKNAAVKTVKFTNDALEGIYGPNDKPETYSVTLPYYKLGLSDAIVEVIAVYLWKWVQLSHIRLNAVLLPQFGLTLDVGDKFIADFSIDPILPNTDKDWAGYFMIYNIVKAIGKEVEIDCVAIPEPIIPSKWCEAKWCMGARWK